MKEEMSERTLFWVVFVVYWLLCLPLLTACGGGEEPDGHRTIGTPSCASGCSVIPPEYFCGIGSAPKCKG